MLVQKRGGFTLVELLIVLSIVAILAMVAAPKMVESNLLSTLTQVSQDQRLIQSALDAYFQDYGGYPKDHDASWPMPVAGTRDGFTQLTSPIQYMARVISDPFWSSTTSIPFLSYEGGSGSDGNQCGTARSLYQNAGSRDWARYTCIHAYLIISIGPDQKDSTSGNDEFPYGDFGNFISLQTYSPTNGSKSRGDVYRFTGDYRRGNVILDGVPLRWLGQHL